MATTDVSAHRAATDAERSNHTLDQLCVNTIRTLAMDAVQQANSGHPGTPMALAPVVYCLWQRFLRFDPSHPIWPNRDRFVLSVGHASMLLYSMLHLTGVKAVKGLIPIDREALGAPDLYGRDRIFVYLRLQTAPDATQDTSVEALERAGHPVVRIALDDPYDLGEEFFRWEFATAVAGSILGINPFDQPDVEASKIATRKLTDAYEKNGALPAETPIFTGDGIMLFTDERNAADLAKMLKGNHTLEGYLEAHLSRLRPGDYFALLAYIEMNEAHEKVLQAMRHGVRDVRHIATCLEFGPRFLHSTGQAYKGGPNTGVFLQITCDDAFDLAVPGQKYTFGVVKGAQARGDFEVLLERKRRALRAHLGADVAAHLATLQAAFVSALRSRATSSPDLASLRRT